MSDFVTSRGVGSLREPSAKTDVVCVVGLGYVGLPLACEFDREGYDVVGYDINEDKVSKLQSGKDTTNELGDEIVERVEIDFTSDETAIGRADFVFVAVPTPVDEFKHPNLESLKAAGTTIGRHINKGTTVILESTVYPGATRNVLGPTIESTSGLAAGSDFYLGYSPERMDPGSEEHGLRQEVKIVSGQTDAVAERIATLYEGIIDPGVHVAPKIEVAEAAKCVENIQRDLNIALVNELAIACDTLGIDHKSVLEAASTKWNFHEYKPGLVGGHCIPVDPFFIIYEAERNGFSPQLIQQAREVNDYMPRHAGEKILKTLNRCGKVPCESTVLILGLTYKPGVNDVRTSAIGDTIEYLREFDVTVAGFDPIAKIEELRNEFDIEIRPKMSVKDCDGIVLATPHEQLLKLNFERVKTTMLADPFVFDVDGVLEPAQLERMGFEYESL